MPSYNKVTLIGNLTRDPEVRYTPKGSAICEIGLAINRTWKDDDGQKIEEVTFVDVILWAKMAELAGKYLTKGRPVFIEGRLQMDSWEDKQTGQKRSRMRVVGEQMQFLGSAPDSGNNAPARSYQRQAPAKPAAQQQAQQNDDSDGWNDGMADDDIAF